MTFYEWAAENVKSPKASIWDRSDAKAAFEYGVNAPWLSLAHTICSEQGISPGHIMDRLEQLRDKLQDDLK